MVEGWRKGKERRRKKKKKRFPLFLLLLTIKKRILRVEGEKNKLLGKKNMDFIPKKGPMTSFIPGNTNFVHIYGKYWDLNRVWHMYKKFQSTRTFPSFPSFLSFFFPFLSFSLSDHIFLLLYHFLICPFFIIGGEKNFLLVLSYFRLKMSSVTKNFQLTYLATIIIIRFLLFSIVHYYYVTH